MSPRLCRSPGYVAGCHPNLWYLLLPKGVAAVASILRISCHCRRDLWCAPCRCRLGHLDMSLVGPCTDSLRHPFRMLSFINKNYFPSPNLLYRVLLYRTLGHRHFVFFFLVAVYRRRNLNNPIDPWQVVCFLQTSLCSPAQRGSRAEPLREETSGYDRWLCPENPLPEFGPSYWKSDIRCQFCGAYPARRVSMY